jgi:hypothetical protein
MAWSKNVIFGVKTDAAWTIQDPIIPVGALLIVADLGGRFRLKVGDGNIYSDTKFVNETELDGKIDIDPADSTNFLHPDGTADSVPVLTIQDFIDAGYHLLSSAEWDNVKLVSVPTPSFVATPGFSQAIHQIGDTISGSHSFSLAKVNNSSIKLLTGGNVAISEGVWSGDGDFNLEGLNTLVLTASSFTRITAGIVTFTLYGLDLYDQQISLQTFDIEFQYPIWMGTRTVDTLSDQYDLSNLSEKTAAVAHNLEFYMDPLGVSSYFHLLVPDVIAGSLDIRDLSAPAPGSANMVDKGTVVLTVGTGGSSVTYRHYVTDYQSAAEIDFILKDT